MMRMLRAFRSVLISDLSMVLEYLTFRSPELWLFGVCRRFLVKHRFNNFGGIPKIESPVRIYAPERLRVSGFAIIAKDVLIDAEGGVTIGHNTGIASGTKIRTQAHVFSCPDVPWLHQGHRIKPVVIGNDVWVANNCFILPGTVIGDHCVISSCSVVSGLIPPYSIMAGNPARRIGSRQTNREGENN